LLITCPAFHIHQWVIFAIPVLQGTWSYSHPTKEEMHEWKERDEELWERERKHLHEFNLKICKFATKKSNLTKIEVKL
jgi:hypothetical protein